MYIVSHPNSLSKIRFSFLIFSEVLKALLKTRDLFESWKMGEEGRDLRSAEEQEWSTTELRNSLRSIEWDLEVRFDKMMFHCKKDII